MLIVSPDCLFLSCLDRLLSRTQQTSGVMSSSAGPADASPADASPEKKAAVFAGEAPPVKLRHRRFHPQQKSRSNGRPQQEVAALGFLGGWGGYYISNYAIFASAHDT